MVYLTLRNSPSGAFFYDSTLVNANGKFSFQLPIPMVEGVYSFEASIKTPNILLDSLRISTQTSQPQNQFWVGKVNEHSLMLHSKMAYPMDVTATFGDGMGRILKQIQFPKLADGSVEIDFPFPTGMYWIRLETEVGTETVKWIQR
jgi:hypothetical protein